MKTIDVIYNRFGKPIYRMLNDGRLVYFDGRNGGLWVKNNLYNYRGKHVGWYEGGLVRDHQGRIVGFGEKVTDTIRPFLPFKQFKPFSSSPHMKPLKPLLQFEPFKPFKSYGWSSINLGNFFD
ncbi:hypothetical protein C4564_02590 [Candidatus Microgenomates bacterium]|nr:MAG: hypothetical protein C4564_02590 [Candidatus Microgenomates bacterium]